MNQAILDRIGPVLELSKRVVKERRLEYLRGQWSARTPEANGTEFIYAVKCLRYVKIGRARSVVNRVSGMQTGTPIRLELLGVISTTDAKRDEQRLHEEFSDYRMVGEWFNLPNRELKRLMLRLSPGPNLRVN